MGNQHKERGIRRKNRGWWGEKVGVKRRRGGRIKPINTKVGGKHRKREIDGKKLEKVETFSFKKGV